ncbi:TetR/AcrR family transcriptional regulator [Streptomyces profundus]|uniref:TetR/AcrR family transcriptional regulator n=1 Tax=Streptomyces profundus TaxID=2867410 RepID=UPI001D164924|nr:TetR/AcrR family transcriptional regulator [Streptomyces sp. MA3_2.13]UED86492.1 TetR/AcrR family transcriptional regulator [Streptomyces sp. MA3_2.13]
MTTGRLPRADARRNRERLLAEARAAFAEHGTGASLEEIAARAGVGIGTLYRHFPSRQHLLEALLREHFDALGASGRELLASHAPWPALTEWTRAFVAATTTFRGLTGEVTHTLDHAGSSLHAACRAMREAGEALLDRARKAGEVRPDVTTADFFVLVSGVAWAHEQGPADSHERIDRLLTVIFAGIRPTTPAN